MTKAEHFSVAIKDDALLRDTKADPISSIAELIWNSLDADATQVSIELEHNDLAGGLSKIVVYDNGSGFPRDRAKSLFGNLGGSWKRTRRRTERHDRMVHGQEGRGRYKALALGRVAVWKVCYDAGLGPHQFEITLTLSNLTDVEIGNETPAPGRETGVVVEILEPNKDFRVFTTDEGRQELAEAFALYLLGYQDVTIQIAGVGLDARTAIRKRENHSLPAIQLPDGTVHSAELDIVEWNSDTKRRLYLCTAMGFPLDQVNSKFHVGFPFSAYLKSTYVEVLHKQQNQAGLGELDPHLFASIEHARNTLKEVARQRAAEQARSIVDEWKAEDVYPFKGEPSSVVETAERQVFDIVAAQVQQLTPDIRDVSKKSKALHLRMIRNAIETGPEELQLIFKEVLDLPVRQQKELAELLQETSLTSIITAAKTVANRLKFITALESIVFNKDTKQRLKERTQLHKILAENTWVFGEQYNLWVSDGDLKRVLEKHRAKLDPDIDIEEPVKVVGQTRGIVDLMFSRSTRRHRADDIEHLVVELKAPKVKVDSDAITQAKKYAQAVSDDERFRTVQGVRWHFWIVSNELDNFAEHEIDTGPDKDRRLIARSGKLEVGIKTWGELIEENRARLQFFQEQLKHTTDESTAIKYLQQRHARLLEGVFDERVTEESESVDHGS